MHQVCAGKTVKTLLKSEINDKECLSEKNSITLVTFVVHKVLGKFLDVASKVVKMK